MKPKRLITFLLLLVAIGIFAGPALAGNRIRVVVDTVLASEGSKSVDPKLSSSLVEELQALFRYSSYRLLSQDRKKLDTKETGTVSLPGKRVLKITPTGITEKRVELQLVILKRDKQVFQTVVQLLNHASIIVGGPKYKDGSLLFKISASF